jgi:CHASE1-domain containing sensor protein
MDVSPNVALISGAIALLALVISIFGASWLNQRATERLLDQSDKRFDQRADQSDKRFDQRVDQLEKRMDQRLAVIDQRLDRIERQLEAVFKPILQPR